MFKTLRVLSTIDYPNQTYKNVDLKLTSLIQFRAVFGKC